MRQRHIRTSLRTLRASKWRSLMTMTGIILGVVSVVSTVSLGEGIKQQVITQMTAQGSDLITIRPGSFVKRNETGTIIDVQNVPSLAFGAGSLADSDIPLVAAVPGVKTAVPIEVISSGASADNTQYVNGLVVATSESFPEVYGQEIAYGSFFGAGDKDRHVVVIGTSVAADLFKENVPIGRNLKIRGQDFIVTGVFADFPPAPFGVGVDYDKAIFMPYSVGKTLGSGTQLSQILVRVAEGEESAAVVTRLRQSLAAARGGQEDFTVLRQDENVTVIQQILTNFTVFIAGIAGLSLLVGGIGIMNIMLVAVTERTREIGIRKALGATNRHIAHQFFVEAAVLSLLGGLIGVVIAYILNFGLRVLTPLEPVISWQVVAFSTAMSLVIGIVFGIIPAVRAAQKDPIQALRYE